MMNPEANSRAEQKYSWSVASAGIVITLAVLLAGAGAEDLDAMAPLPLRPDLKYPDLASYQEEIKEPGLMLESKCVNLFAPERKAREARIIFKYLVAAYDQLYRIVGLHTTYRIVVYHFPDNHPDGFGATSKYTIWYGYKNLDLQASDEWRRYKVPHVSGYIEEMAHNFVHESRAQFGWEMIGWSIAAKATVEVAGNPIHIKAVRATRQGQEETFRRYQQGGFVFPADLPANQCDRIHAHILWRTEKRYGHEFWPDFFAEIRKERDKLIAAASLGDSDRIRNRRYQITVDCFDRLQKVKFKETLKRFEISLLTDVKSLHPTDSGWNRRFIPSGPEIDEISSIPPAVDVAALPPLHAAAYGGHTAKVKMLIQQGQNVRAKGPNGWTPLHMAAMGGHQSMAQHLLHMGADGNAKDNQGYTPAQLAKMRGHNGTAELLSAKESTGK